MNFAQLMHQGVADPSHSMANSGGSGGSGGGGVKYRQLDKLYGVQSQAAQYMLDQAMPRLPGVLNNSGLMVQEAMDGTLGERARNIAGNDAAVATKSMLDANNRNMQRYGMGFDANRMLSEGNRNAINAAAMKVGAMNQAGQWAEDQKWNRNAGYYAQVSGTGSGAMSGLSSAGAGMSGLANMQNQNAMANAAGYGQAGAAMGAAMMRADGGAVRLASGGNPWEEYKRQNPVRSSKYSSGSGGNGYGLMLTAAAPGLASAWGKDLLKGSDGMTGKGIKYVADAYKTYQAGKNGSNLTNSSSVTSATPLASDGANTTLAAIDGTSAATNAAAGAGAVGTTADGLNTATSTGEGIGAASNATSTGAAVSDGVGTGTTIADTASSTGAAADTASAGSGFLDWLSSFFNSGAGSAASVAAANGGKIDSRKLGLHLAGGGSARPLMGGVMPRLNGVASMDASMRLPSATGIANKPVQLDKQAAAEVNTPQPYKGNTEGYGETSPDDKDGFGKEHGDYRHYAAKGVLTGLGYVFNVPLGMLAEPLHTVGEPLSRGMVRVGSHATGSSAGAMITDPIATTTSGAYTPQQIALDGARENAKIASAAGYLIGDPVGGYTTQKIADSFADGGGADYAKYLNLIMQTAGSSSSSATPTEAVALNEGGDVTSKPMDEREFQKGIRDTDWFKEYVREYGEEPDLNTPDYDYRKAWAAGIRPVRDEYDGGRFHWSSSLDNGEMLKSENHPTAWKEHFMRATGKNPDAVGATKAQWDAMRRFNSGGDVARIDFRPGGDVSGPGTATSDSIPAWLSDGEYVLNTEAVKLIGEDKLEKLNNAGLAVRRGKATPAQAKKGSGLKLAKGGKATKKGC